MSDGNADGRGPGDDELREMLRRFLAGDESIDPQRLAGAAGLPSDPASLARLVSRMQGALEADSDRIDWSIAEEQARTIASESARTVGDTASLEQAMTVATLWLSEATDIAELTGAPQLIGRAEWVRRTMPLWTQLAEPVATSIADSLTAMLREQAPEEMQAMLANAQSMMRSVGGTLFSMQLGQVVGRLAREVVSGGDIGIPLLEDGQAALLPQNVAEFGAGLDIPDDQVQLYLAVREIAHARLFRHAKWLRLQLLSSITRFANGITIDTRPLMDLAENFDPSEPERLSEAMASGELIPPKSPEQEAALARLETTLALIEGWVEVVTSGATERLPRSAAIAETVRRRRAAGGPAESAFATLVGLELRPRRLREAAACWRLITETVGAAQRDALWTHPDLLPDGDDLDDPSAFIERLRRRHAGEAPERDELDEALDALLREEGGASDPDEERDD